MNEAQVQQALAAYGLTDIRLGEHTKGYRNTAYSATANGTQLNLILYKDEQNIAQRIRRTNHFGNFVANSGLPARHTADTRILQIKTSRSTRYAALYHYLPGATIAWESYTQKHLKLLGMTLGKLHASTKTFGTSSFPNVCDEYLEICARMDQYFSDTAAMQAAARKLSLGINLSVLNNFQRLLQACKRIPEQQILHMDFVRSNILFTTASLQHQPRVDDIAISGILDFEKAAYGHRIFDIARTLAFLLVDSKYKSEAKIRKYFLYSGYIKRGGQTIPRITVTIENVHYDVLEELISLFLMYDLYKFMRHNPYEGLTENEHFCRTRDTLLARKVILQI